MWRFPASSEGEQDNLRDGGKTCAGNWSLFTNALPPEEGRIIDLVFINAYFDSDYTLLKVFISHTS